MNNSTDTSVSLGNGTYIEQKKSEYEKKFTDFITMQRESSANKENIWNFIEDTIKETLLMAKEKTMLEEKKS